MEYTTLPMRLSALARALAPALVLALGATTASAQPQQQWKWRDAGGRITVSDLPPPRDVADKDILQRPDPVVRKPAPTAAGASAAASGASGATTAPVARAVDKDLEARKRAAEAERQAKAKAEEDKLAQQRAENCRRARSHIATLESGQRIARVNAKGEREILDDAARATEMRQAREVAASECR
jgi:Domain of unknown function (DUF4124)